MIHASRHWPAGRPHRPAKTALGAALVALLVLAQALTIAHQSDAAQHTAGIDTATAAPAGALADAGASGHSGDQDPADSAACELCHVAGKLPAIADAALERVATAVAPPAPNPVPIRVLAAAAHYRSALPRAPPRGTIETH